MAQLSRNRFRCCRDAVGEERAVYSLRKGTTLLEVNDFSPTIVNLQPRSSNSSSISNASDKRIPVDGRARNRT